MNLRYYIFAFFTAALLFSTENKIFAQCSLSLSASLNTQLPEVCFGSNGVLTINMTGEAPFTIEMQHNGTPQPNLVTNNNEEVYSGLAAGVYNVVVTDNTGCTAVDTKVVSNTPALELEVVSSQFECFFNSGEVAAVVSGGASPYAYLWSNNFTSSGMITLAPGVYTVTTTDANGCTQTGSATIIFNGNAPVVSAVTTSLSCAGTATGSADITVTGGQPPYNYLWSNSETTEDLAGLQSGLYSLTVTDVNGCGTITAVLIESPAEVTAVLTVTQASCAGTPNGAVQVAPVSGGAPFSYLWSNGESLQNISSLAAGTYTVTITDAQGCTSTYSATISYSLQAVTIEGEGGTVCAGVPINFTAISPGATAFFWTDGVINYSGANLSFTALSPGVYNYTVTAIAPSGCTGTAMVGLTVLDAPNASITGTTAICNGASTTLTAAGGSFYTWSTGETTASITLEPETIKTIVVTVTNGNICLSTAAVVVGPVVLLQATVLNSSCDPGSNGTISLNVSGGQAPYNYLWSNNETTINLSDVAAGVYTATVTDASGCSNTVSADVGLQTQISGQVNPPVCGGATTGSVILTLAGGSPPFTFFWSDGQTGQNLLNQVPGMHSVTVQDANNCTVSQSFVIPAPISPISIQTAIINIGCDGTLGAITPTVTGGAVPYSFLWTGPNGFLITTQTITGLQFGGTYTLLVTDNNGCTQMISVFLEASGALFLTPIVTNATCGQSDGSINLHVSGGTGLYTYLWSETSQNKDIFNLAPGIYSVTVTDTSSGCSQTATATVQSNSSLTVEGAITHISCYGSNDGAIALLISGSAPPFTYGWSNNQTTQQITTLGPGMYTVTVGDAVGCLTIQTFEIIEPQQIQFNFTAQNPDCSGQNNGLIVVEPVFGVAPFIFDWGQIPGVSNPASIGGLGGGVYSITITDNTGCSNNTSITLTPVVPPSLVVQTNPLCGSTVVSVISVTGGLPPFAYFWNTGQTTTTIVAVTAGVYTVTVIDANGCSASAVTSVTVIPVSECIYFSGKVVLDANENCINDNETGLANWIVRAMGTNTVYGVTKADGSYLLGTIAGGNYTIDAIPPGSLWQLCPGINVTSPVVPDTLSGIDLTVQSLIDCPELEVFISSGNIRRCMNNNFYKINYCNVGTTEALDAYVDIVMDPLTAPVSSGLPWMSLGNNTYRFELGDLSLGACGSFQIVFSADCDVQTGQTICATAHIYPDSICLPANAQWSGASLEISAECASDSLRFLLRNGGTGAMNNVLEYIVVEDHVMLLTAPILLGPNETHPVAVPANGSTWRVSIPQEPFHPGNSHPSLTIEGCTTGATFSTGFVNQFPLNQNDPWIDIDCKEVTGAFDPNDKQGFPVGYGAQHYIEPGTPIEYLIRFQNTGNDTAFIVQIVDTLSAWLDPATIRPGASSHPYTFDLSGAGIVTFTFSDILLPDSTTNEPASHGFVQFTIAPDVDIPLETTLENTAAIYFDANAPVITNTTLHTVGTHFLMVGNWETALPDYIISANPNPSNGQFVIMVNGPAPNKVYTLQISDILGRVIYSAESDSSGIFHINETALKSGHYYFSVYEVGRLAGSGKVLISSY